MRIVRRQFLQLVGASAMGLASQRIAAARAYPAKPVRVIVPFAPAGGADIVARLMGQWLSERLGQSFIIENRPGAGGNTGTEAVAKASPDGYTLLLVGGWNAINATLYDKLSFNFIRDVAPVAAISREAIVMLLHPSLAARTVPEFIAYANANPGKVSMASGGNGSPSHMSGELFKMMARVNTIHVPYRGVGPALTDLLGGQVQAMFTGMSSSIEYIRAGNLRLLAVTTATRAEGMLDIPTVSESVPGYEASAFYGIGVPTSTPAEIIDTLNKEINAGLADPKLKARFAELGSTVVPDSPAELGKMVARDTEKWATVIRSGNIKPE
jgi:tripartite-type tricarboxylate transporter receptor subunit TctC